MNRSSFALAVLLTALAGPLLLAGTAHSQTVARSAVCTPPVTPVHPADLFGLLPYPDYFDDYADAEAADSWGTPDPAVAADAIVVGDEIVEDWRDFETFGPETSVPPEPVTNAYDDLFESFRDLATNTIAASAKPVITEVDPREYKADVADAPAYEPYATDDTAAEESTDSAESAEPFATDVGSDEPVAAEPVVAEPVADEPASEEPVSADSIAPETTSDYPSPEAYESEFSGYGTTDYLRDNFNYEPVREFDLEEIVAARPLRSPALVQESLQSALESQLVTDGVNLANEAIAMGEAFAAQISVADMIEASELAWERIEEQRRLSQPPLATIAANSTSAGFRLADDHCGWDCDYNWRDSVAEPVAPPAIVENSVQNRDALLTLARSLRSLASQLDSASLWLARLGGHDVAELEVGGANR